MKKIGPLLCAIALLITAAVLIPSSPVSAFQNSGAYRISPGGFLEINSAALFETSAANGANVGLMSNASNVLYVTQNDGATKLGSVVPASQCGTAAACSIANTASPMREVTGTVTLSSGAATLTTLPFTATATFGCIGTDQTAAAAVKIVPASATTATVAGTTSDVVFYDCKGS